MAGSAVRNGYVAGVSRWRSLLRFGQADLSSRSEFANAARNSGRVAAKFRGKIPWLA
jgi:hypothetical protein